MHMMRSNPQLDPPFQGFRGDEQTPAGRRDDLEFQGSFVATAIRCQNLGWRLAAVDARELVDLAVNFRDPVEDWLQHCGGAGSLQGRVNLGVHTGSASGLVVLEVGNGEGQSALDHCGSWRSSCQARMKGREQHYFALPAAIDAPPTRYLMAARVMVFGEGGLAPLPPSVDMQTKEAWRWTNPPWECPPPDLPRSLQGFFRKSTSPGPVPEAEDEILPWDQVFSIITPHDCLLKALLAPADCLERYYREILGRALKEGFHDRKLLLSLLWHAPQGDVEVNPGRAHQLKRMVHEVRASFVCSPGGDGHTLPLGTEAEGKTPAPGPRYEAVLGELKRLMRKAAELQALLLDYNPGVMAGLPQGPLFPGLPLQNHRPHYQDFSPKPENSAPVNDKLVKGEMHLPAAANPAPGNEPPGPWQSHYSQLAPVVQAEPSAEIWETAIKDCLEKFPDLAQDPAKLQMVQYCFKNYVNIDPNLVDLTFPERWERASQMAREFMGV
jgi:hypothetical protein